MSSIPGLFVAGEANFSDHGANRLGASALMQGLADGYFVIPYSIANYIGGTKLSPIKNDHESAKATLAESQTRLEALMKAKGSQSVDQLHRKLGKIIWDNCGMARNEAGLNEAMVSIQKLKEEFANDVRVPGDNQLNSELEKANRVADFLELGELMCLDALERKESCGGHFREEMQTPEGEALRDDKNFSHVAAWEFTGKTPKLHKEALVFENIHLAQRSYK
jgi:succinate dehydrogenase / fumarate reductase flavoprotein subunit